MKLNPVVYIIIAIVVLVGLFFVFKPKTHTTYQNTQAPVAEQKTETPTQDLTSQKEVTLDIKDYKFTPSTIRIKTGTRVTWTNRDTVKHSVVADDDSFKTELIGQNESASGEFNKAGTFGYYCGPHPYMRGTIIVEAEEVQSNKKTFNLIIKDKKIVQGDSTLKVNQNDEVTINITSDVKEEFHVHAYDNSVKLEPGKQVVLTFIAKTSGRFPFELEESKTDIGVLEVQPK